MIRQAKFIFILSFLAIFLVRTETVFAQYERPRSAENSVLNKRNAFISVGSGIHYKYGILGLGFGMMLNENVLGELNLGMGVYGFKSGFTAVFNAGSNKKWRPTLGFSRVSGADATPLQVEVVHQLLNHTLNTKVDLAPAFVLIPGFQRVIVFRKGSNLAFDFGLAIALNTPTYQLSEDIVTIDGKEVPTSALEFSEVQKLEFRLLRPSGIKIGMSYNFGL
jgi:hypothetical protein